MRESRTHLEWLGVVVAGVLLAAAVVGAGQADGLADGFARPARRAQPWAYWWWLKGNVTKESITRDLEAMRAKGIAGVLQFDSRGYHESHVPPPPSRMDFMSPKWRAMLKFAVTEAARLGLTMSVNLSSGAGALKGPWPVGDDAPKKLVWSSRDVVGGKQVTTDLPKGDWGRHWDIAVLAGRWTKAAGGKEVLADVVDLTARVRDGRLTWNAPAGRWVLVRLAYVTMAGHEYDVDILDPKAVEGHFDRMGRTLIVDAGPLAGKTLTHFYSVSWEGAAPTWTRALEQEFRSRRGYDPRPYLPALAGLAVRSKAVTQRFLRDYYKTLGECFRDNCYGTLRRLCNQAGMKWHSESGGPWRRTLPSFRHADQLAFLARNDMPQGEFWVGGRGMNRPAAMAAHTYGLPLAATEAFTHMRMHWSVYPALLKPDADAAFCDGTTQFIWHTFTASPKPFGAPGVEYFAGTHLNPRITWWHAAGEFLTYLARCQHMLRHGRFVADVCCYVGDRPYQHWGRGEKWSKAATLALPAGYTYDLVNTEVLLDRLTVRDGRLVLPDGMSYRLLAVDLDDAVARPEALRKVLALARAGATVVLGRRRPTRSPGLRDYPGCDRTVQSLAEELWGKADEATGTKPARRTLGKGQVISGTDLTKVLADADCPPDFAGLFRYIHRRGKATDMYFLAGSGRAECTFRVAGRRPELWDPVSGRMREAVCFRPTKDGRTAMPIDLPPSGSVFVVFRAPSADAVAIVSTAGPEGGLELAGPAKAGAMVPLWKPGEYRVTRATGKPVTLVVKDLPGPMTVTGPWQVRFAPGWGAPKTAVFPTLIGWDKHADEGIRHFSGTATYRKTVTLTADQARGLVRLDLGRVCYIARVRVNGKHLGCLWTAPWRVDLTGVVRPGENHLEIAVTNVWANRLIGDVALPADRRRTGTNVRFQPKRDRAFRHFMGFAATDPLMPSGLLGPVVIEFGREKLAPLP